MKKNGKIDYDITLEKLIKRDKNICYLCKIKCNMNDHYYTKEGHYVMGNTHPVREHIIALINGGTHTWDNVALACNECNTKKSDKQFFENPKGQLTFSI